MTFDDPAKAATRVGGEASAQGGGPGLEIGGAGQDETGEKGTAVEFDHAFPVAVFRGLQ